MRAGQVSKVKLLADKTVKEKFWNGEARGFTWDGFAACLSEAFANLAEHGKPCSNDN